MKRLLSCLLILTMTLPLAANPQDDMTELETLIKLEKQLNKEAAAYNALEGLRYLSLVGIVGGVALGSATMTMGTLDLFESEKQ